MSDGDGTAVLDHMWWGDRLEVAVYNSKHGRVFRVQFTRSVDGILKRSGGGGYKPHQKGAFKDAVAKAKDWAVCELGCDLASKVEWSKTKPTRGMKHRDKQELTRLTPGQRRELAEKLRNDEIDFSDSDSTRGDSDD